MEKNLCYLCIALLILTTGCRKLETTTEINNCLSQTTTMNKGYGSDCPISSCFNNWTEVDYNFSYNQDGNPVEIAQGILVWHAEYDNRKRLKRVYFTGVPYFEFDHVEFRYSSISSNYPESFDYYVSNYQLYGQNDSLNATGFFQYNQQKNLTTIRLTNYWDPAISYVLQNTYNSHQNVVECHYAEGGITPELVYSGQSYDDNPNFFSSNKWTNFILLNPLVPSFSFPDKNLTFSRNNAINWTWFNYSFPITTTTDIVYNASGFADNITWHYFNPDFGGLDVIETANSTCDNQSVFSSKNSNTPNVFLQIKKPKYNIHGRNSPQ